MRVNSQVVYKEHFLKRCASPEVIEKLIGLVTDISTDGKRARVDWGNHNRTIAWIEDVDEV
jgi:hypothetical protein